MKTNLEISRRTFGIALATTALATNVPSSVFAGPQDPLPAGSKVLQAGNALVTDNGQAANLFIPRRAILTIDFAVEQGKELKLIVITDAQFKQVASGRKITGEPVHGSTISGVSAQEITLARGNYVLFFGTSQTGNNARVTYRCHYRYA
jgi:hypothetical protein